MSDVEAQLTRGLGGWAAASVAVGAVLAARPATRAFLLLLDTTAAARLR